VDDLGDGLPKVDNIVVRHGRGIPLLQQGVLALLVQLLGDDAFEVRVELEQEVDGVGRFLERCVY